jgi:hypothetical protein
VHLVERRNTIAENRLVLIKREDERHFSASTLANQALLVANMNETSQGEGK